MLKEPVLRDGMITEEEARLMDVVTDSLINYALILDKAWGDGIITDFERLGLEKLRNEMWMSAFSEALSDGHLSHDEYEVLQALIKVIKHLEDLDF